MRTAPAPNIPPIPGMCPSVAVLAGGGDGGGGTGDSASNAGGKETGGAAQGAEDAKDDSRSAAKGAPDYKKYPECGYASHPVDVVTGRAFTHPATDLELEGPLPLVFTRMYSAKMADRDVGLGYGWGHTFGWEIEVGRRAITVWNQQGVAVEFPSIGVGDEVLGPWGWVLRRDKWGFAVDADDGVWHVFSESFDGGRTYKLTAIDDRNRNRVALTYEGGRLVEVKDSVGRVVRVKSTREGRMGSLEVQNAVQGGRWVAFATYAYDERGNLAAAADADGRSSRFEYDEDHRLTLDQDRAGLTFHFVYDHKGRCVESWGDYPGKTDPSLDEELAKYLADGTTRAKGIHHCRFSYFEDGYSEVADSTQVMRFFGNKHGTIDKSVLGGGVMTARYDERGHLVARTDALGATTLFERDRRGRIVKVTDPLGHATTIERDAAGLPIRVIDAAGGVSLYERDRSGNVILAKNPLGHATQVRYDERGQPVEVINANGAKTVLTYDAQSNIVAITQPNGGVWRYAYNAFGWRTATLDPMGATRRFVFSERGDLLAAHDAVGGAQRFEYDGGGHLVREVSPAGRPTEYVWGGYHRMSARTDANGGVVRLRYDLEGQLRRLVNARGEEHRFEYDAAGRLVGETTFDGRALRYKNDALGRVVRAENGAGEATLLAYGPNGELLSRTYDDDSKDEFAYDALGNVVEARGPGGVVRFEYDAAGRLLRELQKVGDEEHAIDAEYDPLGQRIARRTSLGHTERIDRDVLGSRKKTVLDHAFEILHQNDAMGRETERLLPGGGRIASVYDAEGRLGRRLAMSPTAARPLAPGEPDWIGKREQGITADKTFRYDWDGDVIEAVDAQRGATEYAYDPVGQLVSMVPPKARPFVFRYDAAGNMSEGESEAPRAYDRGRLVRKGNAAYRWDEDGRLVEKRVSGEAKGADAVHLYEWNAIGQLRKVTAPGGVVVEFAYDPFARRVQKKVSRIPGTGERAVAESLTRFVWDGDQLVHEIKKTARRGGDPVVEERTYCFEDYSYEPAAHKDDTMGGSGWFAYLNDPSGAPERLLGPDGQIAGELERGAWGKMKQAPGSRVTTPLRLAGQYEDAETELAYNFYRYYDADAGRFISPDPLGVDAGPHPYLYAPSTQGWVDPLGLYYGKKPVLLGRNMKDRVSPTASKGDYHTFETDSSFTAHDDPKTPDELAHNAKCEKAWEKNQRRWMRDQLDSGRPIYDVGDDPNATKPSKYCQIEHDELTKAGFTRLCAGQMDVNGRPTPVFKWIPPPGFKPGDAKRARMASRKKS